MLVSSLRNKNPLKTCCQGGPLWFCLYFIYLTLLPFNIGPTVRYAFSILLIGFCLVELKKVASSKRNLLSGFVSSPLTILVLALFLIGVGGAIFSPDVSYSLGALWEEFFLNFSLFLSLSAYLAVAGLGISWMERLLSINCFFVSVYLLLLLQWFLMPWHPLFPEEGLSLSGSSGVQALFAFGNGCTLFNGIKHTSLYLTLMIAISYSAVIFKIGSRPKTLLLLLLNLFLLFTTARRGVMLAAVIGVTLSSFMVPWARRYALVVCCSVALLFGVIFLTGNGKYFVREDWNLIKQGRIEEAKKLGGSIPLRISTYRTFIQEIAKDPLRPKGFGRKLIKEHYKEIVKRAGLQHAHNVFLDFAFELGVQGAIVLLLIAGLQYALFWRGYSLAPDIGTQALFFASLVFLVMFWISNLFTDGFCHGTSTLYWLYSSLPTGLGAGIIWKLRQNQLSKRASTN